MNPFFGLLCSEEHQGEFAAVLAEEKLQQLGFLGGINLIVGA